MGATDFWIENDGKDAEEAFRTAVEQALYDYGHAGYSGTIAEKVAFIMIDVPDGMDPAKYAQKLMQDGDERIDDKWGPAGCVKLAENSYLFFGWASS